MGEAGACSQGKRGEKQFKQGGTHAFARFLGRSGVCQTNLFAAGVECYEKWSSKVWFWVPLHLLGSPQDGTRIERIILAAKRRKRRKKINPFLRFLRLFAAKSFVFFPTVQAVLKGSSKGSNRSFVHEVSQVTDDLFGRTNADLNVIQFAKAGVRIQGASLQEKASNRIERFFAFLLAQVVERFNHRAVKTAYLQVCAVIFRRVNARGNTGLEVSLMGAFYQAQRFGVSEIQFPKSTTAPKTAGKLILLAARPASASAQRKALAGLSSQR
jgi:hypothetical protein